MEIDKSVQNSTILDGMFPQIVSRPKSAGKQKSEEPQLGHGPEPHQPTLEEIWEWFGNPDKE